MLYLKFKSAIRPLNNWALNISTIIFLFQKITELEKAFPKAGQEWIYNFFSQFPVSVCLKLNIIIKFLFAHVFLNTLFQISIAFMRFDQLYFYNEPNLSKRQL
jgi:hypothetical protein